eukprot:268739-Heterocapsa_arctica.AAC.1
MKKYITTEKGATIEFIIKSKGDSSWQTKSVMQEVGHNRTERMRLSELGAMRVCRMEALDIIKEKQELTDISIVMEVTSNAEEERVHFKLYRNCAIRHYASYLHST